MSVAHAAAALRVSASQIYQYVSLGKLHAVRAHGLLIFPRGEVLRFQRTLLELDVVKQLVDGTHPLDIFFHADGQYPLREVDRVMREWAKLTGVWLIEAPRGSYARWLSRVGLERVSPRLLRRFVEAMLTDPVLSEQAREYFSDRRHLNGMNEEKKVARAKKSGRLRATKEAAIAALLP